MKLHHVGIDVSAKVCTVVMDHEGDRTEAFELPNDQAGHKKLIRLATQNGLHAKVASKRVPLSHLLEGQYIGLEEVGDGIWDVYYSHVRLGQMDERILKVEDALGTRMRNPKV